MQETKLIINLNDLTQTGHNLRDQGRSICLCHGVFDLLHIGHLHHLQAARQQADILVVSLTADPFVNKGPDRPAFDEHQRAEMLMALHFVDYVFINRAPTALPVIDALKPNFYAKGKEYAQAQDDLTGMISVETAAVEKHQGQTIFTDGIVHSSSQLINSILRQDDDEASTALQDLRKGEQLSALLADIDSLAKKRVLLVGDSIVDDYHYVNPLGKATKDNIIATQYHRHDCFAGGVLAIAKNLAGFVNHITVVSCCGDDEYQQLVENSLPDNVKLELIVRPGKPTTLKRRFVEDGFMRKLFEVYFMDDSPLDAAEQTKFNSLIHHYATNHDMVMACDFGHGLITADGVAALEDNAPWLAVNAQTNSGNNGFNLINKYKRADFISLDGPEARLALADKFSPWSDLIDRLVPDLVDCPSAMITLGREGCILKDGTGDIVTLPAFSSKVIDRVGAGDAVYTLTAPLMSMGVNPAAAALVGMLCGAIKVGIVGHEKTIDKIALKKAVTAILK